jgi:hypothetical protein
MKLVVKAELRNDDYEKMREGLAAFEKHGPGEGLEAMWCSIDARTVFMVLEGDDMAELQKYSSLYSPFFHRFEIHVVTDVFAFTANIQAVLDMAS